MNSTVIPQVVSGRPQPFHETLLGAGKTPEDGFIQRFLLLNADLVKNAPVHIAVHIIKELNGTPAPYVQFHCHPTCDEIGLVIAPPDELEYEIILGENRHVLKSPASVYIPAGTHHRARALFGHGAYVCILFDPKGPQPSNACINKSCPF